LPLIKNAKEKPPHQKQEAKILEIARRREDLRMQAHKQEIFLGPSLMKWNQTVPSSISDNFYYLDL
jgi:hypothetical protein